MLADQAGVIAENEAALSQKQQDVALEAKEASEVDEDDSSQEQTKSGHASKGNEDGEDDKDGEGDNEDGEDENNDDADTDEKTTTVDDKTEEENNENVRSTLAEASSSGRDPKTTSTEIVVKNIRRDLVGVEKDDAASKVINEVVASYAAGDAIRTNDDHHSCGDIYIPLDVGGDGDPGGVGDGDAGGASGRYTPATEEVRRQEDTPYMLGRFSVVGTSKDTKPFTPIAVKRMRNQISRALASAKKKVAGTPKMTTDQPMERLLVNLYKYADDKKKKNSADDQAQEINQDPVHNAWI
ncbi:hypothetical protein HAX54_051214 [Datura stramonium]|uniref:Uncharacterized protein n=1 Tax=Datura stramonium TaxID=4076 RepID=A0ABS8SXW4_DATST|nr:hypothetical protein [Datura stramonium]